MQHRQTHPTERVECPECRSSALAPRLDRTQPSGYDASQGFCFRCGKTVGAKSLRHKSRSERDEILQKWHDVSTRDTLRLKNGLSGFLVAAYGDVAADHLKAWDVGTDDIGCCVFWYRDETQALRTAKIVPYDVATAKRKKAADSPICWTEKDGKIHHADNLYGLVTGKRDDGSLQIQSFSTQYGYESCLYGAQFVGASSLDTPVLLVEAEKTAVIASLFLRGLVVVATGGAGGITREKAQILAGRDVYVLLDADDAGRNSTERVVDILASVGARPVCEIDGVALLDYLLPDAPKGYDLADYYLSNIYTIRPAVVTAETPQMLDGLTLDNLPDLEDLRADNLPDVDVLTAEIPQMIATQPEIRRSQLDDRDYVLSAILRVYGSASQLQLDELYERLDRLHGANNTAALYHAARAHKILESPQLDWLQMRKTGLSVFSVAIRKGAV